MRNVPELYVQIHERCWDTLEVLTKSRKAKGGCECCRSVRSAVWRKTGCVPIAG